MDNITHSLTGLALSRAGLERFSPRAAWLLLLSANAPDSDIVYATQGAFSHLEHHRGYTHCLLGMPVMAALSVLVIAAAFRQRLPWLRAWILCVIGVSSHLLLDWTNSYGIRLLLPFSSRWFHLDINGLYDDWILLVLIFAAVWPFFVGLINREIGDRRSSPGRGSAIFALAFFLIFDMARWTLHRRVVNQLEARLYDEAPPLQAAALPNSFNPLRWTTVVETASRYQLSTANPFGQFGETDPATFYKPPITPTLAQIRNVDPFRFFLYFARFPVWSQQPVRGERLEETRVELTDLRFGTPGAGAFHCIALEGAAAEVMRKWFTYGSGEALGWGDTRAETAQSK